MCIILNFSVPPEVKLLNPVQSQFLGRDTELHCEIAGEPLAETKWMRGSVKLPFESFKYRQQLISSRDHLKVLSLEIRGLDKSDFGEYSCFASNKYGHAKKSMELVGKYCVRLLYLHYLRLYKGSNSCK